MLEKQGRIDEAEASYKKAIELQEGGLNPKVNAMVVDFNFSGLLNLYQNQGRLADIEPIMQHALDTQEKVLGPRGL